MEFSALIPVKLFFIVVFISSPVERVMIITLNSCGDCCVCGGAHRAEP